MCYICGNPYCTGGCSTQSVPYYNHSCAPPCDTGCPIKLDFSCIIYHKDNNISTELDGLVLTNGVTLEVVIHALDEKIKELNIAGWTLAHLRESAVINTFQQLGGAIDTELNLLEERLGGIDETIEEMGYLGEVTSDPAAENGQYWFRTDLAAASGLRIKLNGSVRTIPTT